MRISDWSSDVCSSDLIALYRPDVAVVTNISLDHKSLDELHGLFGDFADKARVAVVNADDPESAPLLAGGKVLRFGFSDAAAVRGSDFEPRADGCRFTVHFAGDRHDVRSEEHTSELQSLMRISYAVFCLKKKKNNKNDKHKQC